MTLVEDAVETAAQITYRQARYRAPSTARDPADRGGAPSLWVVTTPGWLSAGAGDEGCDDVGGVSV